MLIDVAFDPKALRALDHTVVILVDLVRATTTITTAFDAGCRAVYVAHSIDSARVCARARSALLGGERDGLKVPGFDVGNSPSELASLDLNDQELVLTTTNGTVALHAVKEARVVLCGCLHNASAVVARVRETAAHGDLDVLVVCAGREGKFALDDAYCAGYFVTLLRQETDPTTMALTDSAIAAEHVWLAYECPLDALRASSSGKSLERVGLGYDLPCVAEVDRTRVVPELVHKDSHTTWPVHLVSIPGAEG